MSGLSRSEDKEPHSVFTTTNNDTQQERVDASERRGLCCSYCCKWGAKSTCSKCKFTTYCSTECQVADWKEGNHKHECKQSRDVASGNLEYMEQFREGLAVLAISNENNVNWGNSLLDDVYEGCNDSLWHMTADAPTEHLKVLCAKALLRYDADVNFHASNCGWTLLHNAGYTNLPLLAKYLCKRGADIDRITIISRLGHCTMSSALHLACMSCNTEVISILVDNGANLELRNKGGKTPVFTMSPRVELLRFMEGLGANMRALAGPTFYEEKKYFNLATFIITAYATPDGGLTTKDRLSKSQLEESLAYVHSLGIYEDTEDQMIRARADDMGPECLNAISDLHRMMTENVQRR